MVALSHNRHCFDCGQRGPTYVNMTIGSYVCTACSGILRGINPPHRVKSVSMASFTQEEVDLLTQRGNEYNKHVWLGLHDTKEPPQMDTKDEILLKDYLTKKYEKKTWYQAPTDGLAETAKVMNSQTSHQSSANTSAVRRPMVGGFRIQTGSSNAPSNTALPKTIPPPVSVPTQPPVSVPAAAPAAHAPLSAQNSASTSADLLSDVFGSKPAAAAAAPTEFSQPNFANFSGAQGTQPASNPLIASTGITGTTQAGNTNQWSTLSNTPASLGGDNKYASLTGLFSDTTEVAVAAAPANTGAPPSAAVNWNAINWSSDAAASQSSSSMMGTSPAGGLNWGGAPAPAQPAPVQPNSGYGGLAPAPVSNTGWAAGAPSTGVNPFMVAPSQPAYGSPQVGQQPATFGTYQPPAATMAPTQPTGGFGAQPQPQMFPQAAPAQVPGGFAGFGQQPAVNGQFSATSGGMPNGAANQWGAAPAANQWGAAVPTNQWAAPMNKQPTSVNPFLTQTQAPPVQQQSMATNPFL